MKTEKNVYEEWGSSDEDENVKKDEDEINQLRTERTRLISK